MLPCFSCPSSSHSLKCPAWDLPFSGINFTFFSWLRRIMECKIVSPETTKLFWGQKWREKANSLAENQTNLSYNTFFFCLSLSWSLTLLCLVYSNHWENCAGEIFFWLVIRHKGKFGLPSTLIPFPLCWALTLSHQTFLRGLFLVCCIHTPQITRISDVCPLTKGALELEMWGLFCFSKSLRSLWEMADTDWGTSDNAHCTDLAKERGASARKEQKSQSMGAYQTVFIKCILFKA